jgi:hypothetical protein
VLPNITYIMIKNLSVFSHLHASPFPFPLPFSLHMKISLVPDIENHSFTPLSSFFTFGTAGARERSSRFLKCHRRLAILDVWLEQRGTPKA